MNDQNYLPSLLLLLDELPIGFSYPILPAIPEFEYLGIFENPPPAMPPPKEPAPPPIPLPEPYL